MNIAGNQKLLSYQQIFILWRTRQAKTQQLVFANVAQTSVVGIFLLRHKHADRFHENFKLIFLRNTSMEKIVKLFFY